MPSSSRSSSSSSSSSGSSSIASLCHSCDPVCWVIRLVLLIYAAFIAGNLPKSIAILFDNTVVRLVLVLLILALGTCDPASAILLTIGFVLSIQTANKLHLSRLANHAAASGRESFIVESESESEHDDMLSKAYQAGKHDAQVAGGAVKRAVEVPIHLAQKGFDELVGSGSSAHPAHAAATQASPAQHPAASAPHSTNLFTSPQQLAAMQTNAVSNNQNTEVRTWQEELGPQGLQQPAGFNFANADMPAPFGAGPNCPIGQQQQQ